MNTRVPRILILSDSPEQREQWSHLLPATWQICLPEDASSTEAADVVLADCRLGAEFDRVVQSGVGVIQVGDEAKADVVLPTDASPREVILACELLTEIVRLKRESAAGRQERQKLTSLALTDSLTGLSNRRAWDQEAPRRVGAANGCCLAVLDLDCFKRINDELGHSVGDAVVQSAAAALKSSLRPDDLVARLGGDEFGVLIQDLHEGIATTVIERLRDSIRSTSDKAGQRITASAGFVLSSAPCELDQLFEAADSALRAAKASGRDQTKRGSVGTGD